VGKRTAAASVIDKNNIVAEFTRPEIAFDALFGNRVVQPLSIQIVDNEGSRWTLRPDRQFVGTVVLVQIDGVYHRTRRQQKKSEWEDRALNEKGFRVLHIDAELLMVKRYHSDVVKVVESFLLSTQPVKRLPA
jgi:hypothetical protein